VRRSLAARQGLTFGASNRSADTSVSVPLIETAEGDKKPLDLLDEPMV
jgi:hypothetical protein